MNTKVSIFIVAFILLYHVSYSQNQENYWGPMLGFISDTEALIWIEVDSSINSVEINYSENNPLAQVRSKAYRGTLGKWRNQCKIILDKLKASTIYRYDIYLNKKKVDSSTFTTAPSEGEITDISFIIGSCSSLSDYGGWRAPEQNFEIFNRMADATADFNIWMGDNIYLYEDTLPRTSSRYGDQNEVSDTLAMKWRYHWDRSDLYYKRILSVRPNYAVWDDHDYGMDNSDRRYILPDNSGKSTSKSSLGHKNVAYNLFKNYWGNKQYGENDEGIYSNFEYSDAEFFLMDDRYFRDSLVIATNKPDTLKYWGPTQLNWLKTQLNNSKATFKFIVNGNSIFTRECYQEKLSDYKFEYDQLMNFIVSKKICGVIFLTGDKHHPDTTSYRPDTTCYNLYNYCSSPLTSRCSLTWTDCSKPERKITPEEFLGCQNFGLIKIQTITGKRCVTIETHYFTGQVETFTLNEDDLKFSKSCNSTTGMLIPAGNYNPTIALNVFPNPATNQLNITPLSFVPQWLLIYDVKGKKIREQKFTSQIDIAGLSSGMYLIEARSASQVARNRFVK